MAEWPTWAKLIAGLGFPIFVALMLGGFVIHKLPILEGAALDVKTHVVETRLETSIQTALLRQICRNGAKTDRQLEFCDYGLPHWSRP